MGAVLVGFKRLSPFVTLLRIVEPRNTWIQSEDAFAAALLQPESSREGFVRERWGHAPDVCDEVLRLLRANVRMGGFLQIGLMDFRGQRFGAYVAGEEIGRGGMSVVYAGHRVDGSFDKKVAIKVVLTSVGSAPEAQILASSEHPNIARLYDAGTTELGFRYLVMEFVEGVPCTAYQPGSSQREKLRLFAQVCHAVDAAHRALVVHRDLKPDNILITAEGTPKLLDFGISKMLEPLSTQTSGPRAWTPDYASPEQIRGEAASTLNDVYSLGVILCEWVGGKLPRQLSGTAPVELLQQLATAPGIPLDGDLGAIARKAIATEPGSRYESAGALARDVERYLAGEVVAAQPPTWGYRAGKFIRRHRYAVTLTTLALAALGLTAGFAVHQARNAQQQFNQVRSFSNSVMFELQDAVAPLDGSAKARQMIAEQSLRYLDALAADPNLAEDIALEAARGYLRIAEVQRKSGGDAKRTAQNAAAMARRVNNEAARAIVKAALAF